MSAGLMAATHSFPVGPDSIPVSHPMLSTTYLVRNPFVGRSISVEETCIKMSCRQNLSP